MANEIFEEGVGKPSSLSGNGLGVREELLRHDPLLDCLVELTRIHGRPSTHAALSAGLPISLAEGMTPLLFVRAAARAGFSSRVVRRSLEHIDDALLPVVLLLQGDEACILLGWDQTGENARLLFPETAQGAVSLSKDELKARYTGIAIFSRPHFRFDERAPRSVQAPRQHWFWGALVEQIPLYKDILIAAFLINLFALAMPLFTMNVYDRVVPNYGLETLWMLSVGLLAVLGLDYFLRLLRGHFVDLASARVDLKLSALIMERVLGMRMADRPASVGSFAVTLRSFESIRDFIASATVVAVIDLPFGIMFLIAISWVSWYLVIFPILGGLAIIIYSYVIQHKMRILSDQALSATALRNATLIESLVALETVKANGAEGRIQEKWEGAARVTSNINNQLRLLSSSVVNGTVTVQQLVSLASVIAGVYLIHDNLLTMGGLIACSMLSGRAMAPLSQVAALLMQYQGARSALSSLGNLMAMPTERNPDSSYIHRPEIKGNIEFKNVVFSYSESGETVLNNVSLRINQGERVVIIGRVGSGKTTLQKLIMGLYAPQSGSVLVDGVDLRQLDPADLRRNIGYVGQDAALFYGTLRENISISAPYADDGAIVAAADVAGLTEFVNRHPMGFDMIIGERGESLSGGQRQGVLIARALLLDPQILLLDEPTSALDFSSEATFKEKLRNCSEGKTLLIVTHRTSLLDLATRIIVIEGGKVVADGPRDQVIEALQNGRIGRGA